MHDSGYGPGRNGSASHVVAVGLSIVFLVLSFLPYAAISLGNSTNVSLASIIGALLTVRLLRQPRVLVIFAILCAMPFAATLLRLLLKSSEVNTNAYFTYAFIVFTFFGGASAMNLLGARCVAVLSLCISSSSMIAIVQKYVFLDKGVVPFIELYDVSGYASVASNAETIAQYIRRPFGLFPEPSFLAGTLAIASGALVVVVAHYKLSFKPSIATALALAIFTIYISDSGSGVICIALLGTSIFLPYIKKNKSLILLLPIAISAAAWLGSSIAASRQDGVNTSWNDRLASILGGLTLWTSDAVYFLIGVGRGMIPAYFRQGEVSFPGMTVYSVIPDIYSVLARFIVEGGIFFGVPLVAWMFILILRLGSPRIHVLGILVSALWSVVAGLTISYETAAWIWILPGLCSTFYFFSPADGDDWSDNRIESTSRR